MTRRTARITQGRRRDRRRAASWTASTSASVPAPAAESLGSRPMSTSAVASASASARCWGVVRAPKNAARVDSLQLGTSFSPSTQWASSTVSTTGKSGQGRSQAWHAAIRKPTSNGALWAVSTQPCAKARKAGSTSTSGGAAATIASLMPVSAATRSGIAPPGLTSDENCPSWRPALILTAPISVICAAPGVHPVVSTSTMTKSISSSGRLPAGAGSAAVSRVITEQR